MRSLQRLIFLICYLVLPISFVFGSDFPTLSLKNALKKASSENKNILLYISAKWCGPCKSMDKNVFPNEMVGKEIAKSYVPIEIDGESWRGTPIVKEFNIHGYPTFIILNTDRKMLRQGIGYMDISKFLEFIAVETQGISTSNTPIAYTKTERVSRTITPAKVEAGIKVGLSRTTINKLTGASHIGYDIGSFVSFSSKRLLFRPGLSFIEKGSADLKLTYLQMPIDVGLTIHKSAIFGLPGGYRIIASPYSAILLNGRDNNLRKVDYGLRYGASAYIGDTSRLELIISSEFGFSDISATQPLLQSNRLLNLSFAFTL